MLKPNYRVYEELLMKYNKTNYRVWKESGVAHSILNSWKYAYYGRGKHPHYPSFKTILRIANYFAVPFEEFYSEEEYEKIRKKIQNKKK